MRNTKKAISILLTLLMVVGMMSTFAFAQTVDSGKAGNATITIQNASKGETYTVYKVLNAKVSTKVNSGVAEGITYQLLKGHTSVPSIFRENADGNLVWNGTAPTELTADHIAVLKKYVADENLPAEASATSDDGSALIFEKLTYGYYLIESTQGAAITVTSTKPNAVIYDKNTTVPGGPDGSDPLYKKSVDDGDVYIGQTINFTLTYPTTNYVGSGTDAKKVEKYTVTDTLPNFLDDVKLNSVKIFDKKYGTDKAVEEENLTGITFNKEHKSFDIDWVDESGNSKYSNGSVIEVKYSAVVNDKIAIAGAGSKNKFKVTYTTTDGTTGGNEIEKEITVKTYAIAIKKVNANGEGLAGAKFKVPFSVEGEKGDYTVTGLNAAGTEVEVDDNGVLIIKGINSDGDYKLTETQAPEGYNKLQGPVDIKVQKSEETKTDVTIYLDQNGDISSTETNTVVTYKNDKLAATLIPILNTTGSQLPSTGGIGTTIFYLIGAILVIGAGVVFVTRRRMHSDK